MPLQSATSLTNSISYPSVPTDFRCLSLRDPTGQLVEFDHRLIRCVRIGYDKQIQQNLQSPVVRQLETTGKLIGTRVLTGKEFQTTACHLTVLGVPVGSQFSLLLEHERIPFISYPHEWAAEMLFSAAKLTVELTEELFSSNLTLKDASPTNVLFRGSAPVFVDFLSIEQRVSDMPLWLPYGQFMRCFIMPLLMNRYFKLPLSSIFVSHRNGVEPEDLYGLLGPIQKFLPPFITVSSIPTWISSFGAWRNKQQKSFPQIKKTSSEKATFTVKMLYSRLRKLLNASKPKSLPVSRWTSYAESQISYTPPQKNEKAAFLERMCLAYHPQKILDVGCNTGEYSELACRHGAEVVAIDSDPAVIARLWQRAATKHLNILPLVIDFANPSPALGWSNTECASFLERAKDYFDCVLLLGVLHHLVIKEQIPLCEIVRLTAELTRKYALIEYIREGDPHLQEMRAWHTYDRNYDTRFEQTWAEGFQIVETLIISKSNRVLYWMKRK